MTSRELAKTLFKLSKTEGNIDSLIDSFITYAERKNITHLLPGVLKYIEIFNRKDKDENSFKITVSQDPTKETITHIKTMLQIESDPEIIIDKNILAGFIAEHNGKNIDASAKRYLNKLERELLVL